MTGNPQIDAMPQLIEEPTPWPQTPPVKPDAPPIQTFDGPVKPHRAYQLTLKIQADDWESLSFRFAELSDILKYGPNCNGAVGGSPSSGYTIHVDHDIEMTHERYMEQLEGYLDATRT